MLINGAAGGVGTFAVQIAKALGAEVTGVCSTRNVEMVRAIGADHVVDYTQEDFTRSGQRYDLILDNVGNRAFSDMRRVLTPQGRILPNSGHGGMSYVIKAFLLAPFMRQQDKPLFATVNGQDMVALKELIEAGKVTPVIDRTYPFEEIPAALGYRRRHRPRVKEYPEADHAFMNDHSADKIPFLIHVISFLFGGGEFNPSAAQDSRRRIIAFFDRR